MIISHEVRFVFIHIPKCAGTFIREPLTAIDSYDGGFTARVEHHTELGMLDFVHLPLATLRQYFPEEFDCVMHYDSAAVVRDPISRFRSSVSHYLDTQTERPLRAHTRKSLRKGITELIDQIRRVDARSMLLTHDLIHFQRQVDYLFIDGEVLIKHIFPLERCEELFSLSCLRDAALPIISKAASTQVRNEARVYRGPAVTVVANLLRRLAPSLAKKLPLNVKHGIRKHLFTERDNVFSEVFQEEFVTDFLSEFYEQDLWFWSEFATTNVVNETKVW